MTSRTSPASGSFFHRCPNHSLPGRAGQEYRTQKHNAKNASTIPRIARSVHNKLWIIKCVTAVPTWHRVNTLHLRRCSQPCPDESHKRRQVIVYPPDRMAVVAAAIGPRFLWLHSSVPARPRAGRGSYLLTASTPSSAGPSWSLRGLFAVSIARLVIHGSSGDACLAESPGHHGAASWRTSGTVWLALPGLSRGEGDIHWLSVRLFNLGILRHTGEIIARFVGDRCLLDAAVAGRRRTMRKGSATRQEK